MDLSRQRRILITISVMLGSLLAALETTVVATAMPKVVATLGGLQTYSWVFSVYVLTSTVTMLIWGKLSDIYGRRFAYNFGILIFLVGSMLSGLSQSMSQLIAFRALQGLGAGALVPLGLIIIGEIYTVEERARMQGVFSSVWGIASIVGPLVGGFITDHHSWRWIFYINLPFGLLAAGMLRLSLPKPSLKREGISLPIDYLGAATLVLSISALMLACLEIRDPSIGRWAMGLLVIALLGFMLFVHIERQAPDPLMPLSLFQERYFLSATIGNLLAGSAAYGIFAFIPLFMQATLGTSATEAGRTIMLLLLGWITMSIFGSRMTLVFNYRPLAVTGMSILTIGLGLMAWAIKTTNRQLLFVSLVICGIGMGLATIVLLFVVQQHSPRHHLGITTSSTQFFRNMGGAVGTAIMGSLMSIGINSHLNAVVNSITNPVIHSDLSNMITNPNILFDPTKLAAINPIAINYFRSALGFGIYLIFLAGCIISILATISTFLIPAGGVIRTKVDKPK